MHLFPLFYLLVLAASESCFLSSCEDFSNFHVIAISNYVPSLQWLWSYEARLLAQQPGVNAARLFSWYAKPNGYNNDAILHLAPHLVSQVLGELSAKNISWKVVNENLEVELEAIREDYRAYKARNTSGSPDDWHTHHHPYDDIVDWLHGFAKEYPEIVSMVEIGSTYEDRIIWGLILHGRGARDPEKPKMVLDGSIHGMEKMGSATLQYTLDYLIRDYVAGVTEVIDLVSHVEIHFIPVFNPDGWEHNTRKSRKPNPLSECIGTDLNRNSAVGFGEPGSSADPCSSNYHGGRPFSNIETASIIDYTMALQNVVATWHGHCNSYFFGYAYGWTGKHNRHFDDNTALADKQIEAMLFNSDCGIMFRGGSADGTSLFDVWGSPVAGTYPDAIFDLHETQGKYTAKYTNLMEFPMNSGSAIIRDGRCVYESTIVTLKTIEAEWY